MSLFKKQTKKPVVVPVQRRLSYPIEIVFWKDHFEALEELIRSSELDLNNMLTSCKFKGKLVPEPDNKHDPNAVKVFASLKGRNKPWYHIGYISSDDNELIRPDMKKVVDGTHYWSINMYFDARNGLEITLNLRESQFK